MSTPESDSRIPVAVHARLTGTIIVAGTLPALAVVGLVRPSDVRGNLFLWLFVFPLTSALAAGVAVPRFREHVPEQYRTDAARPRLRTALFTGALFAANFAVAFVLYMIVAVPNGVVLSPDTFSPITSAVFTVATTITLPVLPSLYLHRKYLKATATFVHERKDRHVAALLALCVGWFGGHKFYVGRRKRGVVYLALCWTLVPALVAFYELFRYLAMDTGEFRRRVAEAYGEPLPGEAGDRAAPAPDPPTPTSPDGREQSSRDSPEGSRVDELERLYDLYEEGAISEAEYEQSKDELLNESR